MQGPCLLSGTTTAGGSVRFRGAAVRSGGRRSSSLPLSLSWLRRELIAGLIELAQRHAAGHLELYEAAVEHGREDMATRAYSNHGVWMEVARVLRMDPRTRSRQPHNSA